jgi:hypothetical protein
VKQKPQSVRWARDLAIVFSFAVQHGADAEAIRRAVCRNSQGQSSGPLGYTLDIVLGDEAPASS